MKKTLCILVESVQREYMVRLYMALHAAKRGYQVLLTEQNSYISRNIENSIIFNKDHAIWSEIFFRNAKKRNLTTCALDEEALIIGDIETYSRTRVSENLLSNMNAVFLWGQLQRKNIASKYALSDNCYVTGSPKFDLCELFRRKYTQPSSKKNRRASKILINTRFSYTNSLNGSIESLKDQLRDVQFLKDAESEIEFDKLIISEMAIQNEFESLIEMLSKDNELSITIRPHPAENLNYYKNKYKYCSNVKVDSTSDLRIQILDSDCLIHDGCTTAIEARALGVPVFGLRPSGLACAYDDHSNKYSYNFTSARLIFDYITNKTISDYFLPDIQQISKYEIDNWGLFDDNSTIKMLNILDSFQVTPAPSPKVPALNKEAVKFILYKISKTSELFDRTMMFLFKNRYIRFLSGMKISDIKHPALEIEELKKKIIICCDIDPRLGSLEEYKINIIERKTALIYSKAGV